MTHGLCNVFSQVSTSPHPLFLSFRSTLYVGKYSTSLYASPSLVHDGVTVVVSDSLCSTSLCPTTIQSYMSRYDRLNVDLLVNCQNVACNGGHHIRSQAWLHYHLWNMLVNFLIYGREAFDKWVYLKRWLTKVILSWTLRRLEHIQ